MMNIFTRAIFSKQILEMVIHTNINHPKKLKKPFDDFLAKFMATELMSVRILSVKSPCEPPRFVNHKSSRGPKSLKEALLFFKQKSHTYIISLGHYTGHQGHSTVHRGHPLISPTRRGPLDPEQRG